jgi:hypothetical protein
VADKEEAMHNALVWLARIHLDLHNALNGLSIFTGFLSGALWLYASRIKVPTRLVSGFDGWIGGLQEMSNGLKKQGTWNSYAAIATAIAAILQALAQIFPAASSPG